MAALTVGVLTSACDASSEESQPRINVGLSTAPHGTLSNKWMTDETVVLDGLEDLGSFAKPSKHAYILGEGGLAVWGECLLTLKEVYGAPGTYEASLVLDDDSASLGMEPQVTGTKSVLRFLNKHEVACQGT